MKCRERCRVERTGDHYFAHSHGQTACPGRTELADGQAFVSYAEKSISKIRGGKHEISHEFPCSPRRHKALLILSIVSFQLDRGIRSILFFMLPHLFMLHFLELGLLLRCQHGVDLLMECLVN